MTDAKPTSELLPCPFCGKQPAARWISGSAPAMDDCGYRIDCCRAHAHEDSEEEAVAAWNRRTPAPPPAEVEDATAGRMTAEELRDAYQRGHESNVRQWSGARHDDGLRAVEDEAWRRATKETPNG